jgi:DNA-binding Lrp family transcriptional regulator
MKGTKEMKGMLVETDIKILAELQRRLARGEDISKRALARDLGISTQALWVHMRKLKALGCLEYTPAKYTAVGRGRELIEMIKAA